MPHLMAIGRDVVLSTLFPAISARRRDSLTMTFLGKFIYIYIYMYK